MIKPRHLISLGVMVLLCACVTDGGTAEAERQGTESDVALPADLGPADDVFTPVTASTLLEEAAAVAGTDGRHHVVYELLLTNTKQAPATIVQVDVVDDGAEQVVASFVGDDLLDRFRTIFPSPAQSAEIAPGGALLLYVELDFDSADQVPAQIEHRLQLLGAENPGASDPTHLDYTVEPLSVRTSEAITLGPPLRGEGWVAVNGCCNSDIVHRGSVQSVNGALFNGQRFAIDWLRLGEDGRLAADDATSVKDFHGYGQELLAVADGTVVSALDGLEDQDPGALPDPSTITIKTLDGNHVVLELEDGRYAFYAHIQNGSVTVEAGDRVEGGTVLGLLGNSGNTSAPHLHFHIMDGPSALGAEGLPFVHDEFDQTGQIDAEVWAGDNSVTQVLAPQRPDPKNRSNLFPLNLDIVNFPD